MISPTSGMRSTTSRPFSPDRRLEAKPPGRDALGALGQDVQHDLTERLHDGEVGDVALVLLELPADEPASLAHDRTVQLVHHRRLADARRAGHQHQLGLPAGDHPIERVLQDGAFGASPVQPLWDQEAIRDVALTEREGRDQPGVARFLQAPFEIVNEARGALVAFVRHLREQLEDDVGEHAGDGRTDRAGRRRFACDVAVHPADGVGGLERQAPCEQLIEADAERIKIRAAVDRPVHPSGLFRGDVRQGAFDQAGRPRGGLFPRDARGDAEVGDPDLSALVIEEDVVRLRDPCG